MKRWFILWSFLASPVLWASDLVVLQGGEASSLSLVEHAVRVDVDDRIAETRVRQVFANESDARLEGVYVFPVPPGAALFDLVLTTGGRRLEGVVVEKDRAGSIYESYVARRVDPALLEHVRRNVFRVRVFPIEPRSAVEVELRYRELLPYDHGECRYAYPLAVSSTGTAVAGRFLLDLAIHSSIPVLDVALEGLAGEVVRHGEHEARVVFEAESFRLERDLAVRYALAGDRARVAGIAHRPSKDADGTFLLVLSPQEELGTERPPLDVVFAIDVSGSMAGPKIEQARRALRYAVDALAPADRFEIVTFSTTVARFAGRLVEADRDARERAAAYIQALEARGGTALDEALRTSLVAAGAGSSRRRVVVLLTDGEPSMGERDPRKILARAGESAAPGTEVSTFGVGTPAGYDRDFLARLAEAHGGTHVSVGPEEPIEIPIARFQDSIAHPSIRDLAIDWGEAAVRDVHPGRLPPLARGHQILVVGRYALGGRHRAVLTGRRGDEAVRLEFDLDLPETSAGHPGLPAVWAKARIGVLEYEILAGGPSPELEAEAIALGLEHRIVTERTSFLVLENDGEYRRWDLAPPGSDPRIRDLQNELAEYRSKIGHLRGQGIAIESPPPAETADAIDDQQIVDRLTRELDGLRSGIEQLRAQGIDVARLAETKVPAPLDGKIVAVHTGVGLVMINLGEKHGVEKGMNFTVYRGDQYVGQAIVEEVFPDMASARIDRRFQKLEVGDGDEVTTRIR